MDGLLTAKEVAKALNLKGDTLKRWRQKGIGVPYIKQGATIRYEAKDVLEWIESHKRR